MHVSCNAKRNMSCHTKIDPSHVILKGHVFCHTKVFFNVNNLYLATLKGT